MLENFFVSLPNTVYSMINVTETFLPPFEEYSAQLEKLWQSKWITNRGEMVLELEQKIKNKFELNHLLLCANGTIPLQIALKILGNGGEIITTPFSYIATTSSILWENCTPVFVDINPLYLSIDENLIEAAITEKTTAILATHVFGNPCNVEIIEAIAKKHQLKVIYDAAHSFGVSYKNKSIFTYGDVSTCSFHATKIFHTGEGGGLFTNDSELFEKLYYSHNFGHNGPLAYHGVGINGKISELQAAMGLAVLPYFDEIVQKRKEIVTKYLQELDFSQLKTIQIREHCNWNYSYFPVIFSNESELLKVQEKLNQETIFPRRYFYPSLNTIPFVKGEKMEASEDISSRILCLPLYKGLPASAQQKVIDIING